MANRKTYFEGSDDFINRELAAKERMEKGTCYIALEKEYGIPDSTISDRVKKLRKIAEEKTNTQKDTYVVAIDGFEATKADEAGLTKQIMFNRGNEDIQTDVGTPNELIFSQASDVSNFPVCISGEKYVGFCVNTETFQSDDKYLQDGFEALKAVEAGTTGQIMFIGNEDTQTDVGKPNELIFSQASDVSKFPVYIRGEEYVGFSVNTETFQSDDKYLQDGFEAIKAVEAGTTGQIMFIGNEDTQTDVGTPNELIFSQASDVSNFPVCISGEKYVGFCVNTETFQSDDKYLQDGFEALKAVEAGTTGQIMFIGNEDTQTDVGKPNELIFSQASDVSKFPVYIRGEEYVGFSVNTETFQSDDKYLQDGFEAIKAVEAGTTGQIMFIGNEDTQTDVGTPNELIFSQDSDVSNFATCYVGGERYVVSYGAFQSLDQYLQDGLEASEAFQTGSNSTFVRYKNVDIQKEFILSPDKEEYALDCGGTLADMLELEKMFCDNTEVFQNDDQYRQDNLSSEDFMVIE